MFVIDVDIGHYKSNASFIMAYVVSKAELDAFSEEVKVRDKVGHSNIRC